MKLSTKGRYGLMAMYNLKENMGKGPIALKDIAKKIQEYIKNQLKEDYMADQIRLTRTRQRNFLQQQVWEKEQIFQSTHLTTLKELMLQL